MPFVKKGKGKLFAKALNRRPRQGSCGNKRVRPQSERVLEGEQRFLAAAIVSNHKAHHEQGLSREQRFLAVEAMLTNPKGCTMGKFIGESNTCRRKDVQ